MTASTLTDTNAVLCPVCNGQMWDNRKDKKNPKSPDFKCRDRSCKGVVWPPKKVADITPIKPVPVESKPTMRTAYKQLTEWVISDIAPVYAEDQWSLTSSDIAAITATLFIQACKSGKVE